MPASKKTPSLVQNFFRLFLVLGLVTGFTGAVLLALNFFQVIGVSRKIFALLSIATGLLLLFGWLGQWANAVIEIEVHRNGDCPICRKQNLGIILRGEVSEV